MVENFKAIAQALLQRHYGLELNDSPLCEDTVAQAYLDRGIRPYQAINAHAADADLGRTDLPEVWGEQSRAELTEQHEARAIAQLSVKNAVGAPTGRGAGVRLS